MSRDPVHRPYHHNSLTFRGLYAFSEHFVLPLSHDEVVHGKGSLVGRMPGDHWQKLANLRLLFAYMYAMPAKKLLFMGGEMAQWREWSHEDSLDWHLLDDPRHGGVQRCVGDLNRLYRSERALHAGDCKPEGFAWIDCNDALQSTLSFLRRGDHDHEAVLIVCNFTPVPRHNYRIGVPSEGRYRELINTDAQIYGGSGQGNLGGVETAPVPMHGHYHSLNLTLPPLAAVFLKPG
jgi:1,4-alpha-glucan branching enzyme